MEELMVGLPRVSRLGTSTRVQNTLIKESIEGALLIGGTQKIVGLESTGFCRGKEGH